MNVSTLLSAPLLRESTLKERLDDVEDRLTTLEKPVMLQPVWKNPNTVFDWMCGAMLTAGAYIIWGIGGGLIAAAISLSLLTDWRECCRDKEDF